MAQLSEEKREKARALFAVGKSINHVARELKMSTSTAKKIKDRLYEDDGFLKQRAACKEQFINAAWEQILDAMQLGHQKIKLATAAIDGFQGQIDRLIELLEDREDANSKDITEVIKALSSVTNIPLAQISTYLGTIYDKQALASGDATSRGELTGKDGAPIQTTIDLSGLTIEELRKLAELDGNTEKKDS